MKGQKIRALKGINGVGGLTIFVQKEGYFKPCTDLSITANDVEPLFIEIHHKKNKNLLFNVTYRPPSSDVTVKRFCQNLFSANDKTSKNIIFAGDLNIYTMNLIRKFNTF